MDYNIFNFFDKNDTLGTEIQIMIDGFILKVGKNVVIHKNINIVGDQSKITIIGHDTYIGENVTIHAGSIIGARNILLKGSIVKGGTRYESVIDSESNITIFNDFIDSIHRYNEPSNNKVNIAFVADDYGRNDQANKAIEYYLSKNLLNHASLMINREKSTKNAVAFVKNNHFEKRIGMHFNVTEVNNKYSVNIKRNFGQKINSGIIQLFVLNRDEKRILRNELKSQIECFEFNDFPINYFDSHGHIHFKLPVSKIIKPILLEHKITFVRIPTYSFAKTSLSKNIWNMLYKKKVTKMYSNAFNHFDLFIMAKDIFNIDNNFIGKTIEVMTHPFAYNNRFANRRDIDFTCLLGFIVDNNFQII